MTTYKCTGLAFDWNDERPEQTTAHMIELMLAHGDIKPADLSPENLAFELGEEVEFCILAHAVKGALRLLADKGVIKDSGVKAERFLTGEVATVWKMGVSNATITVVDRVNEAGGIP